MTNTGPARYRALGTTDEVTTCEHCGRDELRGTIVLGIVDVDGNVESTVYYGAVCGARAAGRPVRELRGEARAADLAAAETARAERGRLDRVEHARIRGLDGTADCYMGPETCRRALRGACVAHPAPAAAPAPVEQLDGALFALAGALF